MKGSISRVFACKACWWSGGWPERGCCPTCGNPDLGWAENTWPLRDLPQRPEDKQGLVVNLNDERPRKAATG